MWSGAISGARAVVRAENKLDVEGARALVPALKKMTRLKRFDIGGVSHVCCPCWACKELMPVRTGNDLCVEGVQALMPALLQMRHLTGLNVTRTYGVCR